MFRLWLTSSAYLVRTFRNSLQTPFSAHFAMQLLPRTNEVEKLKEVRILIENGKKIDMAPKDVSLNVHAGRVTAAPANRPSRWLPMLDNLDTTKKHVGITFDKDKRVSADQNEVFSFVRISCRFICGKSYSV